MRAAGYRQGQDAAGTFYQAPSNARELTDFPATLNHAESNLRVVQARFGRAFVLPRRATMAGLGGSMEVPTPFYWLLYIFSVIGATAIVVGLMFGVLKLAEEASEKH
jgi:hypothetical protein